MRLELQIHLLQHYKCEDFNSIKVRLELSEKIDFSLITIFQFHKGAIRTRVDLVTAQNQSYFNSIKVRLEL